MTYEKEYLPRDEELEDVVRVLKSGKAEEVDVPDDDEEPTDEEGAPEGATGTEGTAYRRCAAATRQKDAGQPTKED